MPAFDHAAPTYDQAFTNSLIGRAQRKKVWQLLLPQLEGSMNILEINCGTGEDAIEMARLGHHVIATDVSPQMILQANAKFSDDPELHCRFQVAAFTELEKKYAAESFDLIFSNFGGLNCADPVELKKLDNGFRKLLKPGGKFISVLMGRDCLIERLYSLIRGKTMNRKLSPQKINVSSNITQDTWFYHSSELKGLFPSFRLIKKRPVGLFIPPSYLEKWAVSHSFLYKLLLTMEKFLGNFAACADKGDHIYMHWEKK